MDPWGRPQSMICSDEYEPLIHTLNFHGYRQLLYHLSTVFVMPKSLCNTLSKSSWSTVSKAADRSIISAAIICCFSMAHKISLTNFRRLVSQLYNFLYADWYFGGRLYMWQCVVSWYRIHFSIILEINGRLLTGL